MGLLYLIENNNINNNKQIKQKKQNNISNTIDYKIDYTRNHNNKPYIYPYSKARFKAHTYEMEL
jgi:hypothetical protein